MPRSALVLNHPTVTLAATQAGLDAGDAFECQITSCVLTPTPVYATIPATGCSGASQSPGRTGWGAVVAWLEDWQLATGSLSMYTFTNDGVPTWIRFVADETQYPDLQAEGQVYLSPGAYGGTFGDGSAAPATATWPFLDTPDITNTALPLGDAELADVSA